MTLIKICGIRTPEALSAACDVGADFVGFVFYPNSSRYIHPAAARDLVKLVPASVKSVGLFVNPTDRDLETILGQVPLDMVQLHGDETPRRVAEIRVSSELPVIKALPVFNKDDIEKAGHYEDIADWLLFDAKAAPGQYGGTGKTFDWTLLKGHRFKKPWMLSGGLDAGNVAEALRILSPNAVDVSSGVESTPGIKDPLKIKAFIEAVKTL